MTNPPFLLVGWTLYSKSEITAADMRLKRPNSRKVSTPPIVLYKCPPTQPPTEDPIPSKHTKASAVIVVSAPAGAILPAVVTRQGKKTAKVRPCIPGCIKFHTT